jgi:tetratricopeptide (TPR) repeat protein
VQGQIQPGTVPGVFREIYVGRHTGMLRFSAGEERCALRFSNGHIVYGQASDPALHLGAVMVREGLLSRPDLERATEVVHRARVRLGEALESLALVDPETLEHALSKHVQGVLVRLLSWTRGELRFEEQDPDVIHPYDHSRRNSTGQMLMDGVRAIEDREVVHYALGDLDRVLLASADPLVRFQRIQLTSIDGFVLSRLDGTLTAREITQLTPLPEVEVERSLFGLICTGLAEYAEAQPEPARTPRRNTAQFLRQEIIELYSSLRDRNYFQLLGVTPESGDAQVKAAYLRLAKRYHPDVHHDPALSDLRDRLEAIFFEVGTAYQALQDAAARRHYDAALRHAPEPTEARAAGSAPAPADPGAAAAAAATTAAPLRPTAPAAEPPSVRVDPLEVEGVIRDGEERYTEGRYWEAIAILGVAVNQGQGRLQRRARVALARCLLKYPDRVKDAEKHLRLVIEQDPEHADAHYLLGVLYRQMQLPARAGAMLRRALALRPRHREAAALLEELERKSGAADEEDGVLRRLFHRG